MAHQVPLSMGFSREEYWPFPSPGDLPDSGMERMSSALAGEFSTAEPPGKPKVYVTCIDYMYSLYTFLNNCVACTENAQCIQKTSNHTPEQSLGVKTSGP